MHNVNNFDAAKLSTLLLESNDATPTELVTVARDVASMLKLPLVLDAADADRVLRAGAHRLAAFRATTALFV